MNKKITLGAAVSLIAIASAITFILTWTFSLDVYNDKIANVNERAEIYRKLNEIDNYVSTNFLGSVDRQDILDAVSDGYVSILNDNYAHYNTAEENQKNSDRQNGYLVGIGITATQDESGYIYIDSVTPNSPASKMSIQPGELIVAVNGASVISAGYTESINSISGDVGKSVTLTIRKDGTDSDVMLTIEEIEIISVTSEIIGEIGYIKITSFNSKTPAQFKNAIVSLQDQGAKALVFDLRNNGGGLLNPTIEMLDMLLPEGDIATSTDKNGTVSVIGTSDAAEISMPMTVIVNSRTASAAELFAAALRDYEKAQLVGTTTYGKGVMQNTYELLDGSSITFTTATFKTTVTPNFNGIGLKPNYEVSMSNDTEADLKLLDETTDLQLKKALDIMKTTIQSE
ncbi:MAG: S41 family peptidase [Oscillospiraceae bacterium]|jgi:carboxyl-terminal processing protease